MKKFYYGNETFQCIPETDRTDDADNERRKQLSIETNRRRREMALKVKQEIEKEEKRRKDILKQRREYQNSLNDKLHRRISHRSGRTSSVQQLTSSDLDRTLSVLRSAAPPFNIKERAQSSEDVSRYNNRLESAWTNNRETCVSPMHKYSGMEGSNKHRNQEHYLKTFETKLIEQEEAFRQRQAVDMNNFSQMLNDTVFDDFNDKQIESGANERITYRTNTHDKIKDIDDLVESVDDICELEDSIDMSEKKNRKHESQFAIPTENTITNVFTNDAPVKSTLDIRTDDFHYVKKDENINQSLLSSPHVQNPPNNGIIKPKPKCSHQPTLPQSSTSNTIKSILKKGFDNRYGSNPDIAALGTAIDIRDSVDVTKARSSKLFRSSSFSTGLNDHQDKCIISSNSHASNNLEEDITKKFVRFADDSNNVSRPLDSPISKVTHSSDSNKVPLSSKIQKFTVPGSTPLKPPLHPRSVQEGSYLQATFKRAPVYQPPPRPQKITPETLEKQLEPMVHPKKSSKVNTPVQEISEEKQENNIWDISVDKTPTEKEIEQLWAEVRECLSKSKAPSKPESVGPVSGRTVDSGSDVSIRSAPVWQRTHKITAPFQVRHHRPWSGRPILYPGQESPLKNEVTVHNHGRITPTVVTQQPLNVLGQRDHGFQAVSESLEEFLTLEGSCTAPSNNRLNSTTPATPTSIFLPRPPSQTRLRTQPIRCQPNNDIFKQNDRVKCNAVSQPTNIPRTQLSIDEDKVKESLDRLNNRLKNMTTFV